jgi:hypothetical protein
MADRIKTRVRSNYKKTSQKVGYSPDFTVEAEWGGDDMDDEEALYRWGQLITQVRRRAFDEVNLLNAAEGFPQVQHEDVVAVNYTEGPVSVHRERVEPEPEEENVDE